MVTLLSLMAAGCSSRHLLEAVEVLNYPNCTIHGAGVTQVDYSDVAAIRGSRLLSGGSAVTATGPHATLIAVAAGQQPTPGYGYTLQEAYAMNDEATLVLDWNQPAPDAVLAQVITYPCIVVALSDSGYTRVRAVNQQGDVIGSVNVRP